MDTFSPELRSKTMRAVRSTRTKLEDSVAKSLWRKGLRFRRNSTDLKGKPDISIRTKKFVLFIDSCFWHGCREHCRLPSTRTEYWTKKIEKNRERDKKITKYYKDKGWMVLRIWEHDLKNDFERTINRIEEAVRKLE